MVILTFDYEVFLGEKTGTIEKSVLEPTNKILKLLVQNKSKAIFFIDTSWLLFIHKNIPKEFELVSNQLNDIIKAGSTIELHLHPQWIDAVYCDNRIIFTSYKNYKLHNLDEEKMMRLFTDSIVLLESIISSKIKCFRAGGWCIEPFTTIKKSFEKSGIKYDFSVLPGMYLTGGQNFEYNFANVPKLPFYPFHNSVMFQDPNGRFYEIPVSTYKTCLLYKVINKLWLKLENDKIIGDGQGIKKNINNFFAIMERAINPGFTNLTLDSTSNMLFKFLVTHHFKDNPLIVIVSHPKTFSKQALLNLEWILKNYITINSNDLEILVGSLSL